MGRICLYYRKAPEADRWIRGDRHWRPLVRRVVRGKPRIGGVEKVFVNLCLGLDRLRIRYRVNLPFEELRDDDRVGVLGRERHALAGWNRDIPIVAGIGLMTHPAEWPDLCETYPVVRYLQHSAWTDRIYRRWYGERCAIWPAGIDTARWSPPSGRRAKDIDVLVYDKVQYDRDAKENTLVRPILDALAARRLRTAVVRYGHYDEAAYRALLMRSAAMIFLSESESQGFACLECLSCDVPVLAWDQGWWRDPNRERWGECEVRASSVPYFDARCGDTFVSREAFDEKLDRFLAGVRRRAFAPRAYVLERLTLERSATRFLELLEGAAR
jgi:glycosyltransferase involved in cell wall biosynthesis